MVEVRRLPRHALLATLQESAKFVSRSPDCVTVRAQSGQVSLNEMAGRFLMLVQTTI